MRNGSVTQTGKLFLLSVLGCRTLSEKGLSAAKARPAQSTHGTKQGCLYGEHKALTATY